jgi:hypothetical protein
MALTSKESAPVSSKVDAHSHANLEKQLANMQRDLAALTQKCASLESKLASKSVAGAPSGDFVTTQAWSIWRKKVAKKLGMRL